MIKFIFIIYCLSLVVASDEIETSTVPIEDEASQSPDEPPKIEDIIERRKNCNFIYKAIPLPVCHPLARHDAYGNCLKIVSLYIDCPSDDDDIQRKEGDNNDTTIITDNSQ